LIELLRTSTFRLALTYFGLFAISVMALLGLIYYDTVVYADQQLDETIDAEITGLAEQYRQRGLTGLISIIEERADPGRGGSTLYLLTDRQQRPLAGNLSGWPDVTVGPDGWMRFPLEAQGTNGRRHVAQATSFLLSGGYQLLVGRDLAERSNFQRRITEALFWAGGLTLALGLVGGLVMSRSVLARIEGINRASDRVMEGEFGRRIPVRGTGDEFDRLAQNLNLMLDRIERLMEGMRQVTDNIAHDLRSPLSRLRTRIELALLDHTEGVDYRQVLEATIDEADNLMATFNALLDIAEAEAGSQRTAMSDLDVAALLRDLVDLYEPVADEKGLTLATRIVDGQLELRGNTHLLSRAFVNLIENAIKYTPAPGRIELVASADGEVASLVIADSGPGVPTEARERVFDRFYRLEQSRTTPGNGLGLSLARAVVRLHGGTIRLEDNQPGVKAVITLPLVRPARSLPAPAAPASIAAD